jgi:hypothetical protein
LELIKYVSLAGDDSTSLSQNQLQQRQQLQLFKDPRFYSGWLSESKWNHCLTIYPPEDVDTKDNVYFEKFLTSETMFHDCVTISVNFLVRYPYFRRREQVIQLLKTAYHCSDDRAIDMKVKQGLPLSIFKDFIVKNGKSYSIEPL